MEDLEPGRRRAARVRGATAKKFHTMNQRWLQEGERGLERRSFIRAVSAGELSSPGARKKEKDIRPTQRAAYGELMLRSGGSVGGGEDEEDPLRDVVVDVVVVCGW